MCVRTGCIGLFIFMFFSTQGLHAQIAAFPGAEGAGKFTSGGRGTTTTPTTVYEVTNLNDDNNPGSLRYAINQTVAYRTIVFRVSGTIHLNSKLNIKANTTIAGQTAPGDGICLADYPVVISGDNVIVRYIRARMGDKNQLITSPPGCGMPIAPFTAACTPVDGSGGDDALGNLGNKNIVIDHCSVSWSSDEALTVYRGDSVTMQWNFIEEPLNYSYHFETGDADFEQHGYGGIWGSKHGSFHHNLLAHARNRMPRFAGISTYSPAVQGIEMSDFRNNVIYNWGINNIYGGEGGYYNVVNNYFKPGRSTTSRKTQIVAIDSSVGVPYAKYYLGGNVITSSVANTNNNWLGVAMKSNLLADTVKSKVTVPFDLIAVPMQTAAVAYDLVLKYAGCALPNRDTLDQRIVNDVKDSTGRIIDVQGGYPHGTPYAQTVNAWPALNSTAAPADTDHDGMPDSWETANGLNPNSSTDRNNISANGYTNLENYLNSLTLNALMPKTNFSNFSQTVGTPSAVQTYTFEGKNLSGDVTVKPSAGYEVSVNGTTWFTNSNPLVLTHSNGTIASTTISVRLNAAATGTYAGQLQHISSVGGYVQIALNGTASGVTAVGQVAVQKQFSVTPNPVQSSLVINHPKSKALRFTIYQAGGEKLIEAKAANNTTSTTLSVDRLTAGNYFLECQNSRERVVLNFIKIH
jgi:hypothetical protein